tara:strand:- start:305 stop:466 length:162 start_codon:yes stop_codon:yes gene_type:complete
MFPVGLIKEWIVLSAIIEILLVLGMKMADYFGIVFMRLVMLRVGRLLNTVWKI